MAEIQQTRYDRLIRRVTGAIGPGSKVAEVITELFPMVDVERVPGELLKLSGTRLGFGGIRLPAVVAEAAKIQLFNPVDSGLLVTVTTILASVNANSEITLGLDTTLLPDGPGINVERDTREGAFNQPTATILTLSDATAGPNFFPVLVLGRQPVTFRDENGLFILAPGTGVTVSSTNTDIALSAGFFWRERAAELSELQF